MSFSGPLAPEGCVNGTPSGVAARIDNKGITLPGMGQSLCQTDGMMPLQSTIVARNLA
jgi:hypothetical protein